ncbi:MAG: thiamine phosphate synthase [Candidatus Baltobacteraceae bacterium]
MTDRSELTGRLHGIYAIVNAGSGAVDLCRDVLAGGVRIVQYRAKGGIVPSDLKRIRELTREYQALLILNDDWRAVETFDADGVHLGPDDASDAELSHIRAMLGRRLIGLSCKTAQRTELAGRMNLDYVGVGAIFPTVSKVDSGGPIGLLGLRRVAVATHLPVAAIGGITAQTVPALRRTGVAMVAMISAFTTNPPPRLAAEQLVALWNSQL